ncbi:hypothetical protein [Spiroplasma endosymbiont of Nebria brevicollis]|uniref:hypothetical protein n=1 Tax=Spiroplasma endosymbiont of Nebria brevicollis TaxID=3066284 RepID=UPI00313E5921
MKKEGKIILTVFFFPGLISPSSNKIILPFDEIPKSNKNYRSFLLVSSVSYMTNTNINVGDEYSSTDISVKVRAKVYKSNGEIGNKNCLENSSNSKKVSTKSQQTQHELIENFKKYNPNKVLIDKNDYLNKKKNITQPFNLADNELEISIECTDLFASKGKIKYGIVIYVYEIVNNSLHSFLLNNEKVVEKITNQEKIRERMKY